jgi:hypothetical protein
MHKVQFKVSDWMVTERYAKTPIITNENRVLASTCMLHQPTVRDPNFRGQGERGLSEETEFKRV